MYIECISIFDRNFLQADAFTSLRWSPYAAYTVSRRISRSATSICMSLQVSPSGGLGRVLPL